MNNDNNNNQLITLQVRHLSHLKPDNTITITLQETNGNRILPISIGVHEAISIRNFLTNNTTPRPLSHDLMAVMVCALQGKLDKVVIHSIKQRIFICDIYFTTTDNKKVKVDARPSDAIAIALRLHAPILVTEALLEHVNTYINSSNNANNTTSLENLTENELLHIMNDDIKNENYENAAYIQNILKKRKNN